MMFMLLLCKRDQLHACLVQVFGETWTAPLSTISSEDIRGSMEKEIAEKEYALKKKKAVPKAKAAAQAALLDASCVQVDDDVWSIPSDDGCAKPKERPGKVAKDSTEKDAAAAATAQRKLERQRAAAWRKQSAAASKSMGSLNSCAQSIKNMLEKVKKQPGVIGNGMVADLENANAKITEMKNGASIEMLLLFLYSGIAAAPS